MTKKIGAQSGNRNAAKYPSKTTQKGMRIPDVLISDLKKIAKVSSAKRGKGRGLSFSQVSIEILERYAPDYAEELGVFDEVYE